MKGQKKIIQILGLLAFISTSCKPTITLDRLNPLSCGSLCPRDTVRTKLSIAPFLGLESQVFSKDFPNSESFGLVDLSQYDTTNLAPNGILSFTDNNDKKDLIKAASPDFRDHLLNPDFNTLVPLNFSANLKDLLSRLKSITMPPRKTSSDNPSLPGQLTTSWPVIYTNNMTNPLTEEVIKISGSIFSEKLVIDLFDVNSKFYFDGNSSEYQRNPDQALSFLRDGVEYQRTLKTPQVLNLRNTNSTTIVSTNSAGTQTGVFINMDYFNLGSPYGFYLNGEDPKVSLLNNNNKSFNIVLDNYRNKSIPLTLKISEKSQVRSSNLSSDYQNFLNTNQQWTGYLKSTAPDIIYSPQSLLREGIPASVLVNSEKNSRWNTYGNPKLNILLKENALNCSTNNNQFEMEITRGKGNNKVTDQFCGIRRYQVNLNYGQTLDVQISAQDSTTTKYAKYFQLNFVNESNTNPGKLRIYIPSSSQDITATQNDQNTLLNIGNNLDCGNRIVNHKAMSWVFIAPHITNSGKKCILGDANVVAVDSTQSDVADRMYEGYKKVVIYDSLTNKSNWKFVCEMDGADHVNVQLIHTDPDTGKIHISRFYDVNKKGADGKNDGICGKKLREYPAIKDLAGGFSSIAAKRLLVGNECSVDAVTEGGEANCVSDESEASVFRAEFVDTSDPVNSGNTLHGFVGIND